MKATSCVINGERRAIFKDPITATDNNKKRSAKGLLQVLINNQTAQLILLDDVSEQEEQRSQLITVFEDGNLVNTTDLKTIRLNLQAELEALDY
jgi:hypothetical protein